MSTDPGDDSTDPRSSEADSDDQAAQPTPRTGHTSPDGYWKGVSYAERDERLKAMMKGRGKRSGRKSR